MKVSKRTLQILKNFSAINQNIVFYPGNVIKTVVPGNTQDFFATAPVAETFEVECAIFDIRRFLSCLELFEEPSVEFYENFAHIGDGRNVLRYTYVDKSAIDTVKDYTKTAKVKDPLVSITLSSEHIKTTIKAASLLSIDDVKIAGDDQGDVWLVVASSEAESDSFRLQIASGVTYEAGTSFAAQYSVDRLRMLIEDNYTVTIGKTFVTEFLGDSGVVYHHAGEIEVTE